MSRQRRKAERQRHRRMALIGNIAIGSAMVATAGLFIVWAAAFGAML